MMLWEALANLHKGDTESDHNFTASNVRGRLQHTLRTELNFYSGEKAEKSMIVTCLLVSAAVNTLFSFLWTTNQCQMFIHMHSVRNVSHWKKKKALSHVNSIEELQTDIQIHEQEIIRILEADQNTACGIESSMFSYAVVCAFWSGHVMSWKHPHV